MARGTRSATLVSILALLVGPAAAADGSHNVQRGVSLHYKGKSKKFKGRIKSDPPVCLSGVVTLVKIKRGPNLVLGTSTAASDGSWSVRRKARKGRFYATTPSYETDGGTLCRSVRSPVLDLG